MFGIYLLLSKRTLRKCEIIDAAILFANDEHVCASLMDIAIDNISTIKERDQLITCQQMCEKLKTCSPVLKRLQLSITRCLVSLVTLRDDLERSARTDFVIEHLILNQSRDERNCVPVTKLRDIDFGRLLHISGEQLTSLISGNVFFKKDLLDTIVCIGLTNWPKNVCTAMTMSIKYIPECANTVEKMLSKPAKSTQLSRALFEVIQRKCLKKKIENAARLFSTRHEPLDFINEKLLLIRNGNNEQLQGFDHLMRIVCGHFFKSTPDPLRIRDDIDNISMPCKVTKLLATLMISTHIPHSKMEYVPFLTEAVKMFLNETTNHSLAPVCNDLQSTFMLPDKHENFTFPVHKTQGWYCKEIWGQNLRTLTVATLLAPRGLVMWFGADVTCKLLYLLDSGIRCSGKIRNKITDVAQNLNESDGLFDFLSAFIKMACGPENIWSVIANLNHTALYFICPLIMNEDLELSLELLRHLSKVFPATLLLTEFVLFLTINNPAFTLSSPEYARSALHNEMPKSALQLLERTTTTIDHVLIFDIFQSLNFAEDSRAICMQMDVSEGYERTKLVRQRSKQDLSQWTKELEQTKSSFVTSFEHLLLSCEIKRCCKLFSIASDPLSSKECTVENFAHNLIHDQVMTSIGNDLSAEVFKIRLMNRWAAIKGKPSQRSVFFHTLNVVNKFSENVELIIAEFQGYEWTRRMSSFFRILDLYKHGEHEIAFSYLRLLLVSSVNDYPIHLLDTLVEWSEIGNFESMHSMIRTIKAHIEYADEATIEIQPLENVNSHRDAHGILADFMYNRYTDSLAYINCSEFKEKLQSVMSSENDLVYMKSGKYMKLLTAYTKMDRSDVERTMNEFNELRLETLMCLIKHLWKNWTSSDQMALTVLQLVNVLFCKGAFVKNEKGYNEVILELEKLPAGIFLPVARQLTAKICEKTAYVNRIVSKMLIEYPFDIIPLLLCMENDESRQTTIHEIFAENKENTKEILQYRRLFSFYETIACVKNSRSVIPPKCLTQLGIIDCIRLPTSDDIKSQIGVTKFYPDMEHLPGITCPKVISCRTSDGRKLRQIVKSGDDLRQDSLIQQTFRTINSLMLRRSLTMSSVCAKSQSVGMGFALRCYDVCPVTKACGVLSYCEGTVSLGSYLADPHHGAHSKFGTQNGYSCEKCRDILRKCTGKNKSDKLKAYSDICKYLKPVMRHFFYEHFPEPWLWVDHVRQYTRSVACSSIAGYILGLGDRHPNNILLDRANGDVIHIDFGIAFEQGKILPVPEVVPFRLTRDIVDGFGQAGPDGLFRSAAVECMLTLVQNKSLVLSIVNVLIDDPLCNWTIDISKKCKFQPPQNNFDYFIDHDKKVKTEFEAVHVSQNRNKLVERALTRIREKLSIENTCQAVSNRMNELINEATNPENLCRMYNGWQPYL